MSFLLESAAFHHGGGIPQRHTCDGADVSPPLTWYEVPAAAESLVLIVDDPDAPDPEAPSRTFTHWVVYNLPAGPGRLSEGAATDGLPGGAAEGMNDAHRIGYSGPCPSVGRHRYFFRLYALSRRLPDLGSAYRADVERAMHGHVIGQTELIGTYRRSDW